MYHFHNITHNPMRVKQKKKRLLDCGNEWTKQRKKNNWKAANLIFQNIPFLILLYGITFTIFNRVISGILFPVSQLKRMHFWCYFAPGCVCNAFSVGILSHGMCFVLWTFWLWRFFCFLSSFKRNDFRISWGVTDSVNYKI